MVPPSPREGETHIQRGEGRFAEAVAREKGPYCRPSKPNESGRTDQLEKRFSSDALIIFSRTKKSTPVKSQIKKEAYPGRAAFPRDPVSERGCINGGLVYALPGKKDRSKRSASKRGAISGSAKFTVESADQPFV